MAAHPQPPRWSVEAYLEMERGSTVRHEYIDGHVYATAGGSLRHSRVSVNVLAVLQSLLRGGPCQVFNSDMKVRVDENNFVYPDASVTCDARDTGDDGLTFISHPTLIVEVLSDDSTARYDRGDKFELLYKRIEELREYVLFDTRTMAVDLYRRSGDTWSLQSYSAGYEIHLESIGATIPIAECYEGVSP